MGLRSSAWGVLNMSKTWQNNQISHELYLPLASLIILPDWFGTLSGFKYSLSIYIHATHLHAIELKNWKQSNKALGTVRTRIWVTGNQMTRSCKGCFSRCLRKSDIDLRNCTKYYHCDNSGIFSHNSWEKRAGVLAFFGL